MPRAFDISPKIYMKQLYNLYISVIFFEGWAQLHNNKFALAWL